MLLVAVLRAVLADPDLLALDVCDDARRDGRRRRREVGARRRRRSSSTVGWNVLPGAVLEPVDEQRLALADAVLLASDGDDRVGAHKRRKTRAGTREPRSVAD